MKYEYYTDGACTLLKGKNGYEHGPGGWAFVRIEDDELVKSNRGHLEQTTNNYCELMAIFAALHDFVEMNVEGSVLEINSDSAYCVNMLKDGGWVYSWSNAGWTRKGNKPIENLKLVKAIYRLILLAKEKFNTVNFVKVYGHAGVKWNEYVDRLAVGAKQGLAGLSSDEDLF